MRLQLVVKFDERTPRTRSTLPVCNYQPSITLQQVVFHHKGHFSLGGEMSQPASGKPGQVTTMQYTTLDVAAKQIRVLHLHPGKQDDEIQAHFTIVSLHDPKVDYEALSYVWGTTQENHVAYVQRSCMTITDNLWRALTHLRLPDRGARILGRRSLYR